MKIRVRYTDDIAIVDIDGRININSSKLIETVGSLLDDGARKIIVNMEKIDFIDYNGLSVLAITFKSALNSKAVLKICGASMHIMELLRVVKLDEIFELFKDVDEAVDSFKKSEKMTKEEILEQPLRRRFQRLDIDIPISYKLTDVAHSKAQGHLHTGRIANISGAGVFVRSINILPPGSKVRLYLSVKNSKESHELEGIVMWLADKGLQPDLYPGMGIAFLDISPNTQEEIILFIEKHITTRRL
jgi:anti-sigma B factor antagonist